MLGRKTVQLKESLVAEKQKNDQEKEEMQAEMVNHCNCTYVLVHASFILCTYVCTLYILV